MDVDGGQGARRGHCEGGALRRVAAADAREVPLAALRAWAEAHVSEIDRANATNDARADGG
jgi:hypothetical protein